MSILEADNRETGAASVRTDGSVRRLVIAALAWCVGCGTYLVCDLAGRVAKPLVWMVDPGPALVVAFAAAAASALIFARILPRLRSGWWLLPAGGVSIAALLVAIAFPFAAHQALGTPAYGCHWTGMVIDECDGRDWSFFQDRLGHATLSGTMDAAKCHAFRNGVSDTPSNPKEDGWIRCPDDDPSVWAHADCAEVALTDMDTCFTCGGQSDTHDRYWHSVGFDTSCSRGKVRYGLNIPLKMIDECAKSHSGERCGKLVWGDIDDAQDAHR